MILSEINKKNKLIIFLISVFILSQFRLIDHPWNFTPVIAFGILAGYYLKNVFYGYSLIILAMILGDLIIGFHNHMIWTYTSFLLISLGVVLYFKKTFKNIFFLSILSPSLFFLLTNFGVWLTSSFYTKDFLGLMECYFVALPFYANNLTSTILFLSGFIFAYTFFDNRKIRVNL